MESKVRLDKLDVADVIDYMKEAFSIFELDKAHDCRNVYAHICADAMLKLKGSDAGPPSSTAMVNSPLSHFRIINREGRRRGDYISLDPIDMMWALAGVHAITKHQRKNYVENNINALYFDISARVVRALLDYCVDCQLSKCGERYSTDQIDFMLEYCSVANRAKMSIQEKRQHVLKEYRAASLDEENRDEIFKTEAKNLYLGALYKESVRQEERTKVVYVGFLHLDATKNVLFTVDNDSGLINGLTEVPNVKAEKGAPCFARNENLHTIIGFLLKTVVTVDTKLVNINIHDFELFDSLPCDVYHWSGEWFRHSASAHYRQTLPEILCASIERLLFTFQNEDEMVKWPFWDTHRMGRSNSWFHTVLSAYEDAQWAAVKDPYCSRRFNLDSRPKRLEVVDETVFRGSVQVPDLVKTHLSSVTLQNELRPVDIDQLKAERSPLYARVSGTWYKGSRAGAQNFNFELMEEPLKDSQILKAYSFDRPRKTITTIKALLYIYVFKRIHDVSKEGANSPMEDREKIFDAYWQHFEQHGKSFIDEVIGLDRNIDDRLVNDYTLVDDGANDNGNNNPSKRPADLTAGPAKRGRY